MTGDPIRVACYMIPLNELSELARWQCLNPKKIFVKVEETEAGWPFHIIHVTTNKKEITGREKSLDFFQKQAKKDGIAHGDAVIVVEMRPNFNSPPIWYLADQYSVSRLSKAANYKHSSPDLFGLFLVNRQESTARF